VSDRCAYCPIKSGCDIFSEMCQLTPREIVVARPELIVPREVSMPLELEEWSRSLNNAKRQKRRIWLRNEFKPDRSMAVKYDKRRKPDTPRRQWDRERKRSKAVAI
jgi:hypothetical protein